MAAAHTAIAIAAASIAGLATSPVFADFVSVVFVLSLSLVSALSATLTDAETGRICIYYGCADSVTGIAFTTVDELINHMKNNPL